MHAGLPRTGPSMLAAVLTVGLTGSACADPPAPEQPDPAPIGVSEELELLKEEETVSIASRYEQPISQAPSNVYVITDEDIRHSGATDIPTILRRIPGIEVMQMTGADFNVSARGNNQTSANKMLVLVDGRSIYFDVQGQVYWKAIPVTLPEIKRIEVLKGPASAIYGFNAFDGIINIITKSAEEMKGNTLQFGGGEFGTISSAAIHAGTVGKFGYRLSAGHDQNAQWKDSNALAFRSNKFNAQTEYHFSDASTLSLSGGFTDVNRFDGQITSILTPNTNFTNQYAHVAYERSGLVLRASWTGWNTDYAATSNPLLGNLIRITDRNQSSFWNAVANTYNLEGQHSLQLGPSLRVTYGANYRHNTLSCVCMLSYAKEDRFGIFTQSEWQIANPLTIVAGARYDLDTFINPTFSPRVAMIYRFASDHTVRISASVAYRPPTVNESYYDVRTTTNLPLPAPFNSSTQVARGSSSLHPETIISYDAGYQGWYLKHRVRVRADLFFNHISDLSIGGVVTGPNVSTNINAPGQADIYGGEAGIEFFATKWLSGFANAAYQEIGQSFTGDAKRGAPRWKINAGLRGEWDNGLNSEISYYHIGAATYPLNQAFSSFVPFGAQSVDPRVGSYNLLNMRAGYRFWQQKAAAGYMRDAEVAVSVFNALNDEHKEHPLGDLISRRVMGWLTLRF
jgi:iron complex outermembrane receptor protein